MYHFNIPPCSSSLVVKWAAIVHSHTYAHAHKRSYWDHRTNRGGWELRQHTAGEDSVCVCVYVWSYLVLKLFTTSDIKRKDKNTPLVSTPIYPTDRKWTFKGFLLFSVLFATPCQHTPLFLIWSRLLRAIKCQISLQRATDSLQLLVRLPVERGLTSVGGEATMTTNNNYWFYSEKTLPRPLFLFNVQCFDFLTSRCIISVQTPPKHGQSQTNKDMCASWVC